MCTVARSSYAQVTGEVSYSAPQAPTSLESQTHDSVEAPSQLCHLETFNLALSPPLDLMDPLFSQNNGAQRRITKFKNLFSISEANSSRMAFNHLAL